jgi:hypothetical protein
MRFLSAILLGLVASVIATPAPDMSLFERGVTSFTITCGRGTTADAQCLESFSKGISGAPDTVRVRDV